MIIISFTRRLKSNIDFKKKYITSNEGKSDRMQNY
jgi:hypothetical protein